MSITDRIVQNVKETLDTDIVSYGELKQIASDCGGIGPDDAKGQLWITAILDHILSVDIQIGDAINPDGQRVQFVAWRGGVQDRIVRAIHAIEHADKLDREFAFWLCWRRNVDRFEDDRRPGV